MTSEVPRILGARAHEKSERDLFSRQEGRYVFRGKQGHRIDRRPFRGAYALSQPWQRVDASRPERRDIDGSSIVATGNLFVQSCIICVRCKIHCSLRNLLNLQSEHLWIERRINIYFTIKEPLRLFLSKRCIEYY